MTGQYIRFVQPNTKALRLIHDTGPTFEGVRTLLDGRECYIVAVDGVPNGQGCALEMVHRDYLLNEHGVLWDRQNPVTGSLGLDVDISEVHPFSLGRVLPRLRVRGQFLEQTTGEYFTAIEASDFNLLARYAAGEDIRPILAQRAACGFNMLRVWTLMHLAAAGIGDLDPCPYDKLSPFARLCGHYGLYVEFTAYTSTFDDQHWPMLVRNLPNVDAALVELVNENDQPANRIDVTAFRPDSRLLCSHGSNGSQSPPVTPYWDYATMHFNDAFEWPRKVGHNAMEVSAGPVIANENTRYPDRATSLVNAYDAAAGAALLCAGSCFHSVRGKSSQLWDGLELEAAKAWAAGARSVPLWAQDGRYIHRDDLERPEDLRVYERRLPDGRSAIVHIRG